MDSLTFISNMTAALAWPAAVVLIGTLYRKELRHVFTAMKRLKLGPMEAEMFEIRAAEAKALADALPSHQTSPVIVVESDDKSAANKSRQTDFQDSNSARAVEDSLLALLDSLPPRLALIEAWKRLEIELRRIGEQHGSTRRTSVVTTVLTLARVGVLTAEEAALIRKLYELYNAAITTSITFGLDAALDFIVAASTVLHSFTEASRRTAQRRP